MPRAAQLGRVVSNSRLSVQTRATKAFQIVLALGVLLDRHLSFDPCKRNVGLHAAKFLQRRLGHVLLLGHACGSRENSVGTNEIAALANAVAGEAHGLLVVAPDKLRVGSDATIKCRIRISWA